MSSLRGLSAITITLVGCAGAGTATAPVAAAPALTCVLKPLGQSAVGGTLTFSEITGGVLVTGQVTGLPPHTVHGFHVHEKGDCSAPDGSSAGAHFNPTEVGHGSVDAAPSHVGDLGNIEADDQGVAAVRVMKHGAALRVGPAAVLGRAVIVHANPDDFTTQPTGAAGGRIGCGVIAAE